MHSARSLQGLIRPGDVVLINEGPRTGPQCDDQVAAASAGESLRESVRYGHHRWLANGSRLHDSDIVTIHVDSRNLPVEGIDFAARLKP